MIEYIGGFLLTVAVIWFLNVINNIETNQKKIIKELEERLTNEAVTTER